MGYIFCSAVIIINDRKVGFAKFLNGVALHENRGQTQRVKLISSTFDSIMKKRTKPLTPKEKKFLKDFEGAIKWVKLHREGKVQAKTIEQLLSEL